MNLFFNRRNLLGAMVLFLVFILAAIFVYGLSPASASGVPAVFEIKAGDGFRGTVRNLYAAHIIRSPFATELYLLISGRALELKPGLYKLSAADWSPAITKIVTGGSSEQVVVTIPEGSNTYQIDAILSDALVIHSGDLINFGAGKSFEGMLFPDTYSFFTDANASSVVDEFLANFNAKAEPLLAGDPKNAEQNLILASIVEKEVPSSTDQEMVAGIMLKRLAAGMPLDIDATVCYAKFIANPDATCNPLTAADFKINSPYNTYLNKGLPPGPIGNPGVQAIEAALHPKSSPYWYYLSDPKTGATIYAVTLAQQVANQKKYLGE